MKAFDLHRMAFDKVPFDFLGEVALRSLYTFVLVPSDCTQRYKVVPESADYACIRCSEIIHMKAGEKQLCPRCANPEWTKASRAKRVT